MGKRSSKHVASLLPNEISDFQNITGFTEEVLVKLHSHYRHFSSIQTDDGVIDFSEFCQMIQKEKNMTKRIFNAIDTNKDGVINFREFVRFISCFINGSHEDKVRLSFKIFADDRTERISSHTMISLLTDISKQDSKRIGEFFDNTEISHSVDQTFRSCGKGDSMDFESYRSLVAKNSFILNWLKVDVERIREGKFKKIQNSKSNVCFSC